MLVIGRDQSSSKTTPAEEPQQILYVFGLWKDWSKRVPSEADSWFLLVPTDQNLAGILGRVDFDSKTSFSDSQAREWGVILD